MEEKEEGKPSDRLVPKEEEKTGDPLVPGVYGVVVRWVVLLTVVILIAGFFGFYLRCLWTGPPRWLDAVPSVHLVTMFGAPLQASFAIFSALFVVLILRFSAGPIEFEGLGFKFRGASGPLARKSTLSCIF